MGIVKFFVPVALLVMLGCFLVIACFVTQATVQGVVVYSVKKTMPVPMGSWGFILKKDFEVLYAEVVQNISGTVWWWGCPAIEYRIIGIGRHFIHYECNYTVYTYDDHVRQPQIGMFQGNDSIYLFNMEMRPVIKLRAVNSGLMAFFLFKNGTWTGRLFIDDELVDEQTIVYEHH